MELLLSQAVDKQFRRLVAKPPHALVIVAPEGAGKNTLARKLGVELLGLDKDRLDNSGRWLKITPEDDEAFGIDAIRSAIHFMTMKAAKNDATMQRIAFLPDAHTMTREAQNALLKLLEEPPRGSMLLLTATSEKAMLPTIISRSQIMHLSAPQPAKLSAALEAEGYDPEDIRLAMSISGGLPGLALALLGSTEEHPLREAANTARGLLGQSAFERLTQVDALSKQRTVCLDICYILQQMAQLALQKSSGQTADRWQRILEASYDCEQNLRARANTKLALTSLMLSL